MSDPRPTPPMPVYTHWCHDCGTQWWEDFDSDFDGPILDCLRDLWTQIAFASLLTLWEHRDLVVYRAP
jgi:hypothetical protein